MRGFERQEDSPSVALRAVLQAGIALLLTAALPFLQQVAARLNDRFASGLLGALGLLVVYAIGGVFAGRLSATLAGKPWDGLWACAGVVVIALVQSLPLAPSDVRGFVWLSVGLVAGCAPTAAIITRWRASRRPTADKL